MSTQETTDLNVLIEHARAAWDAMTPAERGAQIRAHRRSWIAAEMALGSDADETAYRAAFVTRDLAEMRRLESECEERLQRALRTMDEMGL